MKSILLFILFFIFFVLVKANQSPADSILYARGEIHFYFLTNKDIQLNELTKELSIDKVVDDTVFCYANKKQFTNFEIKHIEYVVIQPTKNRYLKSSRRAKSRWNYYPSYQEYVELMEEFSEKYPQLCRLVEFGQSVQGRKLLAVKISDSVEVNEQEPSFIYSSSIHGDETGGFVLMLRFIEYLLTNYGTNSQVTNLLDNLQIWINPLANPDGTYFLTEENVFSAKRFNSNNIDLNRNFPDVLLGNHPDNNLWQAEVVAMMDFMKEHQFTMSANLHGGEEVVNYPWDYTYNLHADDDWYKFVSREYADTVHSYAYNGYMNPDWSDNGITNGAEWYIVYGGRQDYANYYLNCREVTLELSLEKTVPEDSLENLWQYNRDAMLNYMEQTMYGIQGRVFDNGTGDPVRAKIEILNHDKNNSFVYSDSDKGTFYRPIKSGKYNLKISANGYKSVEKKDISIQDYNTVFLEIGLDTTTQVSANILNTEVYLYPNPANQFLFVKSNTDNVEYSVALFSIMGQNILNSPHINTSAIIDISELSRGMYIYMITSGDRIIGKDIITISY